MAMVSASSPNAKVAGVREEPTQLLLLVAEKFPTSSGYHWYLKKINGVNAVFLRERSCIKFVKGETWTFWHLLHRVLIFWLKGGDSNAQKQGE